MRGEVSIFREGMLYKGSSAVYNIKYDSITSDNLRSSLLATGKEIYFQTQELASDLGTEGMPDLIETNGSMLTTHDSSHPNWQIQSKELDIYPDDKLVFKNLTFYAGGTPFFWLPYLSQPMDDELGYSFTPGYDTLWGAYLLNRYGSLLGDTATPSPPTTSTCAPNAASPAASTCARCATAKTRTSARLRLYYATTSTRPSPAVARDRSNPPIDSATAPASSTGSTSKATTTASPSNRKPAAKPTGAPAPRSTTRSSWTSISTCSATNSSSKTSRPPSSASTRGRTIIINLVEDHAVRQRQPARPVPHQ